MVSLVTEELTGEVSVAITRASFLSIYEWGYRANGAVERRPIASSGHGQDEERQRTLDAGFDLHLVKLVDPDKLCEIISDRAATAVV
jgi:hypothetical protein